MADYAIELDAVTKRFGDSQALRGVTFSTPVGSVLGVLGPNGAGKTTTINILSTLIRPSSGRAVVAGHDVVKQAKQVRADEMLEAFSLTDAGDRRVSTYSGGMRRRVDIACGLVVPPKVVLLDEPTTGLDPRSRREVWDLIGTLKQHGITVLLTTQYLEEAGRLLRRWRREPVVLIQSLIFPTFLLVVYALVIGASVRNLTGSDSLYGLVPMSAVAGALFGAIGAGAAIPDERASGLLSRLWVLPVHRASALTGRLLAEAGRALVGSIAITAVGIAMGLRFNEGWLAAIGFVFVPVLMVVGFSTVIVAFGVQSAGKNIITGLSTVCFLLLFFNSGMVPIDVFPGWLAPVVRAQPMSPAIEAMRALADGGPTLWPVLQSVAWVVGLVALFGPIAVRGYRVAAESGT